MRTGDKVIIGGRTRLGNMSLVGMQGTLTANAPNAPIGNLTVLVDWEEAGFEPEEIEGLPALINVPLIFLMPHGEETKSQEPPDERPKLRLV